LGEAGTSIPYDCDISDIISAYCDGEVFDVDDVSGLCVELRVMMFMVFTIYFQHEVIFSVNLREPGH
jgi:hypothetical protein